MKACRSWNLLVLPAWLWLSVAFHSATASPGSILDLRAESPTAREARHRRVAERRAGPMVIVHRGASAMAPENSLEAYAAAMNCGADGCEVDLRRTRDGVLVLFHDDMLERLLDEVGEIRELTFAELMQVRPRLRWGRVLPSHGPPTFAAVLELARTRAMLLHLDIKEPDLEEAIATLLDQADAWDHVVSVNTYNATNLLRHPKLKLLGYKAGLFDGRRDMDPAAVRAALPGPGEMIIVDDPRVAACALKRPPYRPVPLSRSLCVDLRPEMVPPPPLSTNLPFKPVGTRSTASLNSVENMGTRWNASLPGSWPVSSSEWNKGLSTNFNLHEFCRSLGVPTHERVVSLLAAEFPEATQPDGDATYQRRRTERIAERAWAARAAGAMHKTPRLVALLEAQLRRRSLHRDWRYHGLEGVMAAQSLGRLRATESVPVLIEAFRRVDPDLQRIAAPQWAEYPLVWRDSRFKMALLPALGELDCPASRRFLLAYVAMDESRVRELAPPEFEEATRALLRQDLTGEEVRALLGHSNSAVRGTAILECLDRPTRTRTQALKSAAPWALELPRAKSCTTAD